MNFLFLILFSFLVNLNTQFLTQNNQEIMELSLKGIEYIYLVKPFEARKMFDELINKYPTHPFGYFGLAMSKWAEFEYLDEQSSPKLDEEYHLLSKKAIEIGEAWVKKNPTDAQARMCLGGIYGLLARLYVTQHRWIKAYFTGKKAIYNMKKSLELDPNLYDAYLGLGLWEYSADTLGGVIKILASFLIRGDATKGIEYLKICAEKGRFNKTAAKLLLIEIFTQTDSKYSNPHFAVKLAKELVEKYPNLAQMHFVLIISLYEAKMYEEAEKEMKEYLRRIENRYESYNQIYYPRIYLSLGTLYMIKNNFSEAYSYFKKSLEFMEKEKRPNRWAVWSIVRMGNIHDLRGERKMAIEMYKKALSYPDLWGFKEYIEENLKEPFTFKKHLATQLPPP
ncbi:MAG: tetratricopeptide repeat protein [Elusimicrobiales bacterium]|nr:tetratricopeptide repeat protein [Elusimicrobiales bacterium]